MKRKGFTAIIFLFLFLGVICTAFFSRNIFVCAADFIYIRADGSVEGSQYIVSSDNVTYFLTADINSTLFVERSNIIIDGNGHILNGSDIGESGISLISVNNITIKNVNIHNYIYGICFFNATNNTIFGNNITNNAYGVNLQSSSNNRFFHNNFINNDQQVLVDASGNVWDNGYPSGGNYWSDYNGIDLYHGANQNILGSDFIGDTQYKIFRNDADSYPFMIPYETLPPTITILSPENKTYAPDSNIQLIFKVNDMATWIAYSLDGQANVTIMGNITLPVLTNGSHSIIVYAKDNLNNTGVKMIYFSVGTILIADAGNEQTVNEDTQVTFDGSASSGNVPITAYTWTFIDGSVLQTLSGMKPTYTFQVPDVYLVTLNISDGVGNYATDIVMITVLDITNPSADAGSDQIVNEDVQVTLDGSASSDNVGIINYSWAFIDEVDKTLSGEKPSYLFNMPGVYFVSLSVFDAAGNYATDNVTITVLDVTCPFAYAGPDRIISEDTLVTLDGSASVDNVAIVSYTWVFTDRGILRTLNGISSTYIFQTPGTYIITLNVTDAAGNSATDTAIITVLDATQLIAYAGNDQRVNEDALITFDALGSTENLGAENYVWTFTDEGIFQNLSGINPSYTFQTPGTYTVTLTVYRNGNNATDTVIITVLDITNPSADAGPDQSVDEDKLVTFNGSYSTDNVAVVSWAWSFIDVMQKPLTGVTPTYIFQTPGEYVVTLNVTDAMGNWDTDTVQFAVLDITAPTAYSSFNKIVNENTEVIFDGSSSTDNVGIVSYVWSFGDETTGTGVTTTHIYTKPGTFTVTLNVTDIAGNWETDTMIITVLDITKPIANAGNDQIVNKGSLVTFNGSGSSDNVGILSYIWTFIDGGMLRTISGMNSIYTFQIPGTYTITLNVTDAAGNYATDTAIIRVRTLVFNIPSENINLNVQYNISVSYLEGGDPFGLILFVSPSGKQIRCSMNDSILFDEPGEWVCYVEIDDQIVLEKTINVELNLLNDLIRRNILQSGVLIASASVFILIFLKWRRKYSKVAGVEWPKLPTFG